MGSKLIWNLKYRQGFSFIGIFGELYANEIISQNEEDEVLLA